MTAKFKFKYQYHHDYQRQVQGKTRSAYTFVNNYINHDLRCYYCANSNCTDMNMVMEQWFIA